VARAGEDLQGHFFLPFLQLWLTDCAFRLGFIPLESTCFKPFDPINMRAISFLSFILLFITSQSLFAGNAVTNLKTEHLVNPLGIDTSHPRFTWQFKSDRQGTSIRSTILVVGKDSAAVSLGNGNTALTSTDSSFQLPVVYDGNPLQPFTRYYWSVRVQDETGEWTEWAEPAFFETGMMEQHNWKGGWITDSHDYNIKPAPWFRKEFTSEKKIASARA